MTQSDPFIVIMNIYTSLISHFLTLIDLEISIRYELATLELLPNWKNA